MVFPDQNEHTLSTPGHQEASTANEYAPIIFISSCILLPLVFILLGSYVAAQFLGLNVAFLVIGLQDFPSDEGKLLHRLLRVGLAVVVLVGSSIALEQLMKAIGLKGNETALLIKRALEMFLLIWGSTIVAKKVGWYKAA